MQEHKDVRTDHILHDCDNNTLPLGVVALKAGRANAGSSVSTRRCNEGSWRGKGREIEADTGRIINKASTECRV
jgi:hypothetical protein